MATTTGPAEGVGGATVGSFGRWLLAWVALWVVLTMLVDIGTTADLAAALALMIAASASYAWLPATLARLGIGG